jgi:hypothetical protein
MSSVHGRDQAKMIHELFLRLHTRYGSAWVEKWAGLDAADVKADWLRVMGHFPDSAIQYALQNLPEDAFAPDAPAFARACLRAPSLQQRALPGPTGKRDPKRLAAILQRAEELLGEKGQKTARARTLAALEAREIRGQLSRPQKEQLTALRRVYGPGEAADIGAFTPIPKAQWPWVQRGESP